MPPWEGLGYGSFYTVKPRRPGWQSAMGHTIGNLVDPAQQDFLPRSAAEICSASLVGELGAYDTSVKRLHPDAP